MITSKKNIINKHLVNSKKIRNINLPWGVMCGIRPAKNVRELLKEGRIAKEESEK